MDLTKIEWLDEPRNEGLVTRRDGTSVTLDDSTGFGWPEWADAPPPEVGDRAAVIGGWGFPFYGVAINGVLVGWRTPKQREEARQESLDRIRERREQEWITNESRLDRDFDDLPLPFQRRIAQLRDAGGLEWRKESESYEMFCCVEAVKIAERFGSPEEIERWYRLPYEEQRAEWDGFDSGHSGNTFGVACSLAAKWLRDPERSESVVVQPQAISPLAGDPRYG